MCNLAAYFGTKVPNTKDLQLLTLLGDTRGGDGLGIYYNGSKYSSLTKETYNKWNHSVKIKTGINYVEYIEEITSKEFLLHHRKSSSGSLNQTHPFCYYDEDDKLDMVFMHNGTIKNIDIIYDKYQPSIRRSAVDSEIMGQIIYENGIDVCKELLTEYSGGANLIWYMPQLDKFYFYKGIDRHGVEERPLSFCSTDEGIYLTSLNVQLQVIGLKGKFLKCGDLYEVERDNKRIYTHKLFSIDKKDREPLVKKAKVLNLPVLNNKKKKDKEIGLLNPHNLAKGGVYWYNGLYYQRNQLLNGIFYLDINNRIIKNPREDEKTEVNKYMFIKGIMIDNEETYYKIINKEKDYEKAMGKHQALGAWKFIKNTKRLISSSGLIKEGYIQPLFSYYIYKVEEYKIVGQYNLPKEFDRDVIENFNYSEGTSCICIEQVEEYFEKNYQYPFNPYNYKDWNLDVDLVNKTNIMDNIDTLFQNIEELVDKLDEVDTNSLTDEEIQKIVKLKSMQIILQDDNSFSHLEKLEEWTT